VIAVASLAIPAVAANPKDGVYAQLKGSGNHRRVVVSLVVSGNELKPGYLNKCAETPASYKVRIRHGRFRFKGRVRDQVGQRLHVSLRGRFRSRKLAVGTIDYDAKGCNAKPHDFKAKFLGAVRR
jgi:hypothetical protein